MSVNFSTNCTNSVNYILCLGRTLTHSEVQALPKHKASFISAYVIILVDEQTDTYVTACASLFTFPRHVCIPCWPQSV